MRPAGSRSNWAAHRQQLERLPYQASLAERLYRKADDNRLVAAELAKCWEAAQRVARLRQPRQQRGDDACLFPGQIVPGEVQTARSVAVSTRLSNRNASCLFVNKAARP